MAVPRFGRVQLQIMNVLWDRGQATAREITDALNESEPIAHSTVQTLLRKLEAKGAVGHDANGRVFVFKPLVQPDKVKRKATRELLAGMFDDSPAGLVAYLLKNERISRKELARLRDLIDGEGDS
jgi:BlaI family penicillinase repressor